MKRLALLLCAIVGAASALDDTEANPEVIAPTGRIRGSLMTSRLGKKIYAFRGVRYAEPPTGQRRFRQAVPVVPWSETFDASEEGPACPQPEAKLSSEDCLRLNVYTTKLPHSSTDKNEEARRPVMVYFHPGGFYGNSGQSFINGPNYLMDQDIVLVTVNYRLASLGFLATGDSLAPGNLGLKDQVEALRWIRKNIASFGGDPDSVTITGYSAGSWSVTLHMVSPMSEGLFHRAIAMSGSATYQELLPHDQKHLAKKQAEFLGCPTDTTANILTCFGTKTAEEFSNTNYQFDEWSYDPIFVWLPVIEPEVQGVERFLPAQPVDLIRQGKFYQVPLITGITKDEFGGRVVNWLEELKRGNDSTFRDLDQNWERVAPIAFLYERDTPRSVEISKELRKFYFQDRPITKSEVNGIAHAYADSVIGFSEHRLVNLMSQYSKAPVYYYRFSYQGRYSHVTWSDTKKPYGVVHHDDLLYLFYVSHFPYFEKNDPEVVTVERLTSMWGNFIKTGQPIPKSDKLFKGVTWEKFTAENKKYLDIGNNLTMKTGLYSDRMELWDRLFPLKPLITSVEK